MSENAGRCYKIPVRKLIYKSRIGDHTFHTS